MNAHQNKFYKILPFLLLLCISCKVEARGSCIISYKSENLLGGKSDTPIMPVKINGKQVAMFVDPAAGDVFLKNSNYMNFDKNINKVMSFYTYVFNDFYTEEKSWIVNVNKFSFAGFEVENAKIMLMKGEINQSVNGIPIVGIIGRKILNNFAVFLDVPHKKIVFYEVERGCRNDEEIKNMIGGDFYRVDIDNDGTWPQVDVKISGHSFPFYVSSDNDMTKIPIKIIKKYNISLSDEDGSKEVNFDLTDRYLSKTARISNISIGGYTEKNERVKISENIKYGSLGADFFSGNIIILDMVNSIMYFRRADVYDVDPGHNFHFDISRTGNVDVER